MFAINNLVVEGQFITPFRYYTKSEALINCHSLGNDHLGFILNGDLSQIF